MIHVRNKYTYAGPGEYIGRPSPLANPYSHRPSKYDVTMVDTREESIALYEAWLTEQLAKKDSPERAELDRLSAVYRAKGELNLICFCAPLSCHGHTIRRVMMERLQFVPPPEPGGQVP